MLNQTFTRWKIDGMSGMSMLAARRWAVLQSEAAVRIDFHVRQERQETQGDETKVSACFLLAQSGFCMFYAAICCRPWLRRAKYWEYLDPAKAPWTIYMAICKGKGMRYNAYGSWADQKHMAFLDRNISETINLHRIAGFML